ncbi:MAG: LamG-like jellyroll fold domain-containing protein [Gemmataceae bacterium]
MNACLLLLALAATPASEPPLYADRADLLHYLDVAGKRQPVRTVEAWQIRVKHILGNMQRVMGPLPAPPTLPLDVQVIGDTVLRHYTRRHLSFAVEKGDRLPGYLLIPHGPDGKPTQEKLPALVCLPESDSTGKEHVVGLTPDPQFAYAHELAQRGYVTLALDYPLRHTREYRTDPYALGYVSATMKGVVNHRRGVDLLASLPFVDGSRIGVIGHSLGGHNAVFLAAFDPRVQAVVSSCGFNVFAKHNKGDVRAWSSRYYMPRIQTVYKDDAKQIPFDFTEVLGSLAPRAVFVNAPLHDSPDFEVSGVRDCIDAALPVYRDLFKAAGRLVVRYPDAGHSFPAAVRQEAYDFLDRNLKPQGGKVDLERGLVGRWDALGRMMPALEVGEEFSVSLTVKADRLEWAGDLISHYDATSRRGWNLALRTTHVTTTQAGARQLAFGIDDNRESKWEDCGRPGNALLGFGMAVHAGSLYVGTCEPGKIEAGHVYRYAGGQRWIDCGAPDRSNSVTALASHAGSLFVGTGKYRVAGSALSESENTTLGGRIFRLDGQRWVDCGQLPGAEAVGGLAVFRGQLYASSLYRPAGFFRYEGGQRWSDCGTPGGKRVVALAVFRDHLYASSYDGGHVYRYDGKTWTDLGRLGENTQTYSFVVYGGRLLVGTWPSGRVYRLDEGDKWTDVGRLGEELEVMGMMVHNGRLLAGTLPKAEVYNLEKPGTWKKLIQLDATPAVKYRRAWTMAEHDGRLFCSTLPTGKIFAYEAGRQVTWDHAFPPGEHHVVAVKSKNHLRLYVDGQLVAQSPAFAANAISLAGARLLRLGSGPNGPFPGELRQIRLYQRALTAEEIRALAQPR